MKTTQSKAQTAIGPASIDVVLEQEPVLKLDQKPTRNNGKVSTKKPVKRKRKPKRQSLLENPLDRGRSCRPGLTGRLQTEVGKSEI